MLADQADHVLGIDTHRDSHSAAILAADTAVVQGQITVAANERGYRRLLRFARESAPGRRAWAVEGTGSHGAGLTVFLQREGEMVLEVDRPRRAQRVVTARSPMSSTRFAQLAKRSRASTSRAPASAASARHCASCWPHAIARCAPSEQRSR
jgi:transposase